MYQLKRVHLVQFFLFQAETLELDLTTAVIAPNGAGKSALLDALQVVMLGGDRNQIRFNAQAGGSHRARSIRDYCLGVYRSGEDGQARKTATTYISLVFQDQASGETLTAGISLGASAAEPDHRMHGLYLLPGVALALDDHLEFVDGRQLPLEWASFRERVVRQCKDAGSRAELHTGSDRFVKDLLHRLAEKTLELPAGVEIHLDLRVVDLMQKMTKDDPRRQQMEAAFDEVCDELGRCIETGPQSSDRRFDPPAEEGLRTRLPLGGITTWALLGKRWNHSVAAR